MNTKSESKLSLEVVRERMEKWNDAALVNAINTSQSPLWVETAREVLAKRTHAAAVKGYNDYYDSTGSEF